MHQFYNGENVFVADGVFMISTSTARPSLAFVDYQIFRQAPARMKASVAGTLPALFYEVNFPEDFLKVERVIF